MYSVLSQYSSLLYNKPGTGTRLRRKLDTEKLSFELESSVACLTSTPAEFVSLDSLKAGYEALKLRDDIQDLVTIVRLRGNSTP